MLTVFRRHSRTCPIKDKGRKYDKDGKYKDCKCPFWAEGRLANGEYHRKTLDTTSPQIAELKARDIEADAFLPKPPEPTPEPERLTITKAVADFFAKQERDVKERRRKKPDSDTIRKWNFLLRKEENPASLLNFAAKNDLTYLSDFTEDWVLKFRNEWEDDPEKSALQKKNERLQSFFEPHKGLFENGENPVPSVFAPDHETEIKIFEGDEWDHLKAACDRYDTRGKYGAGNRARVRAFILVSRYTALRIGDVVALKRTRINASGEIYVRAAKNGKPVWLPVPKEVMDALAKLPTNGGEYFFWTGNGLLKSAVSDWRRSLAKVAKLAGVAFYPHKFRHTLPSELAANGVPMATIAEILGDSIKVVEKHYLHFSDKHQKKIRDAVGTMWAVGPEADLPENELVAASLVLGAMLCVRRGSTRNNV